MQLDRLHAASTSLAPNLEALRLPAAREHERSEDQRVLEHRAHEEHASACCGREAGSAPVNQRPPRCQQRHDQTREHREAMWESLYGNDRREHDRRRQQNHRRDRWQPSIHDVTGP